MTERAYLPAAGRDAFLPLYDPLTRLIGGQKILRSLLDQAALQPNHVVLDVGCGTGTLAVLVKRLHPTIDVTALDPDPKALARAAAKAAKAAWPSVSIAASPTRCRTAMPRSIACSRR